MNITQTEAILSIVSPEVANYSYIHVVSDVTIIATILASETFTNSASYYTFETDGYFIITEFKLPTSSGSGYYILNNVIFDGQGNQISVTELMATDTENTNILRIDEDYITIYMLNDLYIRMIKEKYLKDICNCGCECINNIDKVKLDTLTMGLALLEALTIKTQYYEIQRIVEKLLVCFRLLLPNCNCY